MPLLFELPPPTLKIAINPEILPNTPPKLPHSRMLVFRDRAGGRRNPLGYETVQPGKGVNIKQRGLEMGSVPSQFHATNGNKPFSLHKTGLYLSVFSLNFLEATRKLDTQTN